MQYYTKRIILGIMLLFLCIPLDAQNVGIGTTNPDPSAALEIRSFNKGLLIPVMNSSDRVAILNPAYGLIVFDAEEEGLYWRDSTAWVRVMDAQSGFSDSDGDTKIVSELNADDDLIRFFTKGQEVLKLNMNRLEFLNGGESVFIGEAAGENDDLSLNRNTYVGHQAGQENISGTQNVAIGNQTLRKSIVGNNNTAVGKQSLFNNLASNNSAFGFNAGLGNTTGIKNTILGGNAGFVNKTGNENTFLGYEAGRGSTNTNINGGVMLGHQAGKNETSNNRLYIANDDSSTPLIYGRFDEATATIHGMLGINEKNPDAELIINDNTQSNINSVFARLRTSSSEMIFGYNTTNQGILGSTTYHDLRIRTSDINRMTITKDGDVGIGTTLPDKKLEVRGGVKIQDSISIGPTNPNARFHVRDNGVSNERTIIGILESSTSKRPTLLFSETTNPDISNGMSIEYNGVGSAGENKLLFNKAGGEAAFSILNNGNVGIATTIPLAQLDIRRTNAETAREQVHLWQAGSGDASLRFSRGFLDLQSFNVGIDGTDDKLKIASSKNNIIGGLDNNTIMEINHSKEVNFKGDLKVENLSGSGTRNLKIQNDGKVIAEETFGYYSIALEFTYFNEDAFQEINLELPHGATIEEIKIIFLDNSSGQFNLEFKRGKFTGTGYNYEDMLIFNSNDYGPASPNIREEVLSGNEISFPSIDNSIYSYSLIGFGQANSRKPYSIIIKYAW